MRELKFRYRITAKRGMFKDIDKAHGFKIVHYTIHQVEQGETVFSHKLIDIASRDQFIGIRDINDREVYEGDFLRYWHKGLPKEKTIYLVKIIECNFLFYRTPDDRKTAEPIDKYYKFEVIGNIYDTPELAKEIY